MTSVGRHLVDAFLRNGVTHFCGVPDSVLFEFSHQIEHRLSDNNHVICANEGLAVSHAIGTFIATGRPCCVYMQNSGVGNAFNPLVSLGSERVAGVPMVLVIGWRGQPGTSDEPQHAHQGAVLPALLDLLGIGYVVIRDRDSLEEAVAAAIADALGRARPAALLIPRGLMPEAEHSPTPVGALSRRRVIEAIVEAAPPSTAFVATTGFASRELDDVLALGGCPPDCSFLVVGAMGHASQIGMAVSRLHPQRPVVCIDGDGAALMHLGAMATARGLDGARFVHVLVANGCHESVGRQRTAAPSLRFCTVAQAFGYSSAICCGDEPTLLGALHEAFHSAGAVFIEVASEPGVSLPLRRPRIAPAENLRRFHRYLVEQRDKQSSGS